MEMDAGSHIEGALFHSLNALETVFDAIICLHLVTYEYAPRIVRGQRPSGSRLTRITRFRVRLLLTH